MTPLWHDIDDSLDSFTITFTITSQVRNKNFFFKIYNIQQEKKILIIYIWYIQEMFLENISGITVAEISHQGNLVASCDTDNIIRY